MFQRIGKFVTWIAALVAVALGIKWGFVYIMEAHDRQSLQRSEQRIPIYLS